MLIPLQELLNKYDLHPKGVVAVGAHWAEEDEDYRKCGIEKFVYIEPCKEAIEVLVSKFKHDLSVSIFKNACGATEEHMVMNVSHDNQGQSNSLLDPLLHLEQHPEVKFTDGEIVEVVPLDKLKFDRKEFQLLVMDVQGAEGLVLKGAVETLPFFDAIYTEVNRGQTYKDNMEIEEMDALLAKFGFVRVETYWPSPNWTWGDALFIKNKGNKIETTSGLNNYTESYKNANT